MSRRWVNLVLAASLLAWSSGLLLGIHLHEAGECHDTQHCDQCLLLLANCPAVAAQADAPAPPLVAEAAPAELKSILLVRTVHPANACRAPPFC